MTTTTRTASTASTANADYNKGYSDGEYNLRYGSSVVPIDRSSDYVKGFKAASGYTPSEWLRMD